MNLSLWMKRVKKLGTKQKENRKSILRFNHQRLDKDSNLFGRRDPTQKKYHWRMKCSKDS